MQTMNPPLESVAQAKSKFERINERMLHLLTFVPDDKLTWTPAPTAKSALRIIAHGALTSRNFAKLITGTMPADVPSPQEFFAELYAGELNYTTRESVIALSNETAAELCQAMDSLTEETVNGTTQGPFGERPVMFWVELTHDHMIGHVGQLEYLQTIWGDLDLHFS